MRTSSSSRWFAPGAAFGFRLAVVLAVPLAGCDLGLHKQPAVTPPPAPAAVQAPAPEVQLSIPQTSVLLPSPQEVNPDAVPQMPTVPKPAPEKAETTAPAPRVVRRPVQPKPEPEAEAETPPATAATPAEQVPFQPILSGDEQKRIKGNIELRRREIADWVNRAKARPTSQNQSLNDRISSFLDQSAQAEARGDYTQADTLSERAMLLARELQVE